MATALAVQAAATLAWQYTNALDNTTPRDAGALALALATLTDGVGANQANTIWHDRRTLANGANEDIDLYDFGGGTPSPLGTAIVNARVKLIYIKNRSATAGDVLAIGGNGTTAAFNSLFDGSDTGAIEIRGGGSVIITAPDASGYTVTDVSNHLLRIANQGAASLDYDIVVIGANA